MFFLVVSITSVYSSSVDSVSTDVLKIHCHFGDVVETVGVLCGKRHCVDRKARSALSRPCRPRPPLLASSFCLGRVACVKANMNPKRVHFEFSATKSLRNTGVIARDCQYYETKPDAETVSAMCVCANISSIYIHIQSFSVACDQLEVIVLAAVDIVGSCLTSMLAGYSTDWHLR